ncbi:hypothetical protein SCA05_20900 [Staphylococcus carnosus]|nr:hypothetical protein SCA05_20900 [Staphylococcus carnosus]
MKQLKTINKKIELTQVTKHFNGLYLITPFEQVDYSLELATYFKTKTENNQEAII